MSEAISAFIRTVSDTSRSVETINTYWTALARFQDWLRQSTLPAQCTDFSSQMSDANLHYLRHDFLTVRGRRLSDRPVLHYIAILKTLAKWGARGGRYWPFSPIRDFEVPEFTESEIVPYSRTELASLLTACGSENSFAGRRLRALLLLTLDTGMRQGEVSKLCMEMVDLSSGRIRLPASITRTRRFQVVYLQEGSLSALRPWLAARNVLPGITKETGPLFCQLGGAEISDGAMQELAIRLRARSGVERFRWHLVRHTCGTESMKNGADSIDVQQTPGTIPAE